LDRINHVKIVSPEPEAVDRFLREVLEVPAGWPIPAGKPVPRHAPAPAQPVTWSTVLARRGDDGTWFVAELARPVRELSKGMTQKLGLAAGFLLARELTVLDEPMSGLDPASRAAVKGVLARLRREGRTLLFTSHVLADVEELCTAIAVLERGRLRFRGAPAELCARYAEPSLERAFLRCVHGD